MQYHDSNAEQRIREALSLMRQGAYSRAEQLCRDAVIADPASFAGYHLLGVILLLRGEHELAERALAQAINLDPSVAGAHYNLGNALSALGRHELAIASYDRALLLKADMVEALFNRGNAEMGSGRLVEAAQSFDACGVMRPGMVEAHNNLGHVYLAQGRADEALRAFDAAIAVQPGHHSAWGNRGAALLQLERHEEALRSYDHVVSMVPASADAYTNRGLALIGLGRSADALASLDRAATLAPDSVMALCQRANLLRDIGECALALEDCDRAIAIQPLLAHAHNVRGTVLHEANRLQLALQAFDFAIACDPACVEAHNNRGNVLHDLGRMQEALLSLDTALELRPAYPEAFCNKGVVLQELRKLEAAIGAYDEAIRLKPGYAEAYKRRASVRLLSGDFLAGWEDYEYSAALALGQVGREPLGAATLQGRELRGARFRLSESAGLGDAIQFFRYVPKLAAVGAEVTLTGPASLFRLLRPAAPGIRFAADAAGEEVDYQGDLMSLPLAFKDEPDCLPHAVPYVFAEPGAIERMRHLLDREAFNVGIAWQGRPDRKIDLGRSIPLVEFQVLARIPGVRLVSLQRGAGLEQLANVPPEMSVVDPGDAFDAGADAFIDTAGLLAGLDLVITSDTAIAHLAGAMGRPTWVALKYTPEWRWMLDRSDSPWYPTMRLFRQSAPGHWSSVFQAMAEQLSRLASKQG